MADNELDKSPDSKPEKGKKKGGDFFAKHKPLVIGGMVVILVMLFFFLRSGNSSASQQSGTSPANSTDPATGYPYGSPADVAALNGSGSYQPVPSSGSDAGSTTTTNTTTNNTTVQPNTNPGYGKAGPVNNHYTAVSSSVAQKLLSATANWKGGAARPFIWNGSAYVPVTSVQPGQQYYFGAWEEGIYKNQTGVFAPPKKKTVPKPHKPTTRHNTRTPGR